MSAKQPLPVRTEHDDEHLTAPFQEDVRHSEVHNGPDCVPKQDAYQLVFESLSLDEIIHAVGAVRVRTANFVDRHTAEASASQRQPSTAGVIASHDHCSHTRITVTAKANTHQHIIISEMFKLHWNQEGEENGESTHGLIIMRIAISAFEYNL